MVGVFGQHFLVPGDGARDIAEAEQGERQSAAEVEVGRVQVPRLPEPVGGIRELARLQVELSHRRPRGRVFGTGLDGGQQRLQPLRVHRPRRRRPGPIRGGDCLRQAGFLPQGGGRLAGRRSRRLGAAADEEAQYDAEEQAGAEEQGAFRERAHPDTPLGAAPARRDSAKERPPT